VKQKASNVSLEALKVETYLQLWRRETLY